MKKAFLPFAAALLLLAIGCSEEKAISPNQTTLTPEVTTVDVQTIVDENTTADWSQPEASPQFQAQADSIDTSYDVYAVALIWGQCANVWDSVAVPTDWSGSLSMNAAGSLRVHRTFRFEPEQDTLFPQTDSGAVSWASRTSRDVDGLGLLMRMKRGIVYFTEPTLSFQTAPFSISIPISGLVRYNAFYRLDDHNGVVVFARQIPRRPCPKGSIIGVWHRDSTSNAGPFEALWLNGEPAANVWPPDPSLRFGKAFGRFFITDGGHRMFKGHYTDSSGTKIGDLFGTWEYDDPTMCPMCGSGHAVFRGRFTVDGGGEVGEIRGELGFGPGPTWPRMDMPMHGVWRFNCAKAEQTPIKTE